MRRFPGEMDPGIASSLDSLSVPVRLRGRPLNSYRTCTCNLADCLSGSQTRRSKHVSNQGGDERGGMLMSCFATSRDLLGVTPRSSCAVRSRRPAVSVASVDEMRLLFAPVLSQAASPLRSVHDRLFWTKLDFICNVRSLPARDQAENRKGLLPRPRDRADFALAVNQTGRDWKYGCDRDVCLPAVDDRHGIFTSEQSQ
jgi:hypothetical protein